MAASVKWLAALLLVLFAVPAAAHLMPNTGIYLDFARDRVEAEILIPVGELRYALDRPIDWRKAADVRWSARYVTSRFRPVAPDGRAWGVRLLAAGTADESWAPDIRTRLALTPPAGAPLRRFTLHYDAVTDRVPNHFVLLFARSDYAGGRLGGDPAMIGGLQGPGASTLVDRGAGAAWRGFRGAVALGMHHIAEGHDHLLFLIALLLPAPLFARARRWGTAKGVRGTARTLLAVVSAFTVGHSLTLLGGAFLGWRLPVQPVEIGIALSILISAIHAWRPIFAGREALVAGGFGLVHGLAFATLIGKFGLDPVDKAQAILGFNVGIEVVQLAVVAATMPALLLLAGTRFYPAFRTIGAGFAGVAAAAWLVERIAGADNPVGRVIDSGLGHAPWLLAALTVGAAAAWLLKNPLPPSGEEGPAA